MKHSLPVLASQTFGVSSSPAVTIKSSSKSSFGGSGFGLYATPHTVASVAVAGDSRCIADWVSVNGKVFVNVKLNFPVEALQIFAVPSLLVVVMLSPLGLNAA